MICIVLCMALYMLLLMTSCELILQTYMSTVSAGVVYLRIVLL